jgi:hypothetical protein
MSYIGSSSAVIPVGFSGVNSQSFNGDGSTVAFTLNRPVSAAKDVEVVVNNVQQSPYDSSYSVSGTTLTFSAAPSSGTANIYVTYRDQPVGSITDPNTYTKAQTDALIGAVDLTSRVAKSGDTMTGNLIVNTAVGIGGVTPVAKLNVYSDTGSAEDLLVFSTGYSSPSGLKAIAWKDTGGNTLAKIGAEYFAGNGAITFGSIYASGSNSTERMRIDAAGRVTMPYQPAFRALKNITVPASTAQFLTSSAVYHDRGSCFNSTNGRFTAPVTGVYHFSAIFRANSAYSHAWDSNIGAHLNGGNVIYVNIGSNSGDGETEYYKHASWSSSFYLTANDYMEFYFNNQSGSGVDFTLLVSGHLIG